MTLTKKYFAILKEFDFEVPPGGVKFFAKRPKKIDRLRENMALCEMLKKAQQGHVFFADAKNHACDASFASFFRFRKINSTVFIQSIFKQKLATFLAFFIGFYA